MVNVTKKIQNYNRENFNWFYIPIDFLACVRSKIHYSLGALTTFRVKFANRQNAGTGRTRRLRY